MTAMNTPQRLALVACIALIFTSLFLEQSLGLNQAIFACIIVWVSWISRPRSERSPLFYVSSAGTIFSSLAFLYNHSSFALCIGIISSLALAGLGAYPLARSVLSGIKIGLTNMLHAPILLGVACLDRINSLRGVGHMAKKVYLIIIPLIIIALFTSIYSASNQLFDDTVQQAAINISDFFTFITDLISPETFILLITGTIIGSVFLFEGISKKTKRTEMAKQEDLSRVRNKKVSRWFSNSLSLLDEYKSGVFLMIALNILLAVLNFFDLKLIWFGFEWNGEYLKPMLHEGTYLLIMSILISMGVLLFYFRANINFLHKNKSLKVLSYIWIGQNAFLSLSVLMRTYHYVQHFNLAYRRIALVFFVLLCLAGLFLIFKKIQGRRSLYFIIKRMSLAAYLLLVTCTLPDWDRIIARYNFSHHETAFVHLDFLSNLSNSTLPLLDIPLVELQEMRQSQNSTFSDSRIRSYRGYMSPQEFHAYINGRIASLATYYENQTWLEWNYADYRAYQALIEQDYLYSNTAQLRASEQ